MSDVDDDDNIQAGPPILRQNRFGYRFNVSDWQQCLDDMRNNLYMNDEFGGIALNLKNLLSNLSQCWRKNTKHEALQAISDFCERIKVTGEESDYFQEVEEHLTSLQSQVTDFLEQQSKPNILQKCVSFVGSLFTRMFDGIHSRPAVEPMQASTQSNLEENEEKPKSRLSTSSTGKVGSIIYIDLTSIEKIEPYQCSAERATEAAELIAEMMDKPFPGEFEMDYLRPSQ